MHYYICIVFFFGLPDCIFKENHVPVHRYLRYRFTGPQNTRRPPVAQVTRLPKLPTQSGAAAKEGWPGQRARLALPAARAAAAATAAKEYVCSNSKLERMFFIISNFF